MFNIGADWNPKQAHLKEILLKNECFDEAVALLSELHAIIHSREVYGGRSETLMDEVWEDLDEKAFRTMPTIKDVTCAWNIWHATRIEDLTANLLIAHTAQVLDKGWLARLNTSVTDTGNAMTDDEIMDFSNGLSMETLKAYRNAVGERTKCIIGAFTPADIKRKVNTGDVSRILAEGGVTERPDSIWLLDFWGRKNVAGLLLMPVTRHQVGHLNDCRKLKKKCERL